MPRKARFEIDPSIARDLLDYDPDTGIFRWRWQRGNGGCGARVSEEAGCWSRGYRVIRIGSQLWQAARLAFVIMEGVCPQEVDHIDCDKGNNRWSNLRPATRSRNNANRRQQREVPKGAYFDRRRGVWKSAITHEGKQIFLGHHPSAEKAHEAWLVKAQELYGEFHRKE